MRKSTLGKTILKLHSVTDGQILFHGEDITSYNENQMRPLREKMQIIFQDPYASLNPKKRVAQAVMAPLNVSGSIPRREGGEGGGHYAGGGAGGKVSGQISP